MQKLPVEEVVEVLRQALRSELPILVKDEDYLWSKNNAHFKCEIGDYSLLIFVDAGELDYIDAATCSDGRAGDFDYWTDTSSDDKDPVDHLSDKEHERLTELFRVASDAFRRDR